MEYLRGLRLMREDSEWMSKVGVASLLLLSSMIIPILGQVTFMGWRSLLVRRAVAGQETPMPRLDLDFDYLGKLLGPGFKTFIARMVWIVPVVVVMVVVVIVLYAAVIFAAVGGAAVGDAEGAGVGGLTAMCCMAAGMLIIVPLSILLQLPAMVAALRAEITDDLQAAFDVKAVLGMTREMFRELFIGQLVIGLLGVPLGLLGLLTCGLGMLPAVVILQIAQSDITAQVYELWLQRGGEPLAVGSLDYSPPQPATF